MRKYGINWCDSHCNSYSHRWARRHSKFWSRNFVIKWPSLHDVSIALESWSHKLSNGMSHAENSLRNGKIYYILDQCVYQLRISAYQYAKVIYAHDTRMKTLKSCVLWNSACQNIFHTMESIVKSVSSQSIWHAKFCMYTWEYTWDTEQCNSLTLTTCSTMLAHFVHSLFE